MVKWQRKYLNEVNHESLRTDFDSYINWGLNFNISVICLTNCFVTVFLGDDRLPISEEEYTCLRSFLIA